MFSILNYNLAECGFYINLDASIERKKYVEEQINDFKIQNLTRFSAITDEMIQASCTNSHRAVFQYCLDNGYKSAFIAEDDFEILQNPSYFHDISISIDDFLNKNHDFILNGDYDILQFGCNPKRPLIIINESFAYNYSSTGAWAYIIRENAMKYILDNYNYRRDYQAIDDILPKLSHLKFKTLVTIPQIIKHKDGIPSTLQPHVGITHYSTWIFGNWCKHLYERYDLLVSQNTDELIKKLNDPKPVQQKLTIFINGNCSSAWVENMTSVLNSMGKKLLDCRFILVYDSCSGSDEFDMYAYFRDVEPNICPHIEFIDGGFKNSLEAFLSKVHTDYCLLLDHKHSLSNNNTEFTKLIDIFDKYDFVNAIWLNDGQNQTDEKFESRIHEMPLRVANKWSNSPAIFRVKKLKSLFDASINSNSTIEEINDCGMYSYLNNKEISI
jgi:hypothetical protein